MSILPDSATDNGREELVDNHFHYTKLWPKYDPDTWVGEPPTIRTQIWNDLMRARCEEIERDMRRAQREAEWRRARRAAVRAWVTRVRARWAARNTKAGAA